MHHKKQQGVNKPVVSFVSNASNTSDMCVLCTYKSDKHLSMCVLSLRACLMSKWFQFFERTFVVHELFETWSLCEAMQICTSLSQMPKTTSHGEVFLSPNAHCV